MDNVTHTQRINLGINQIKATDNKNWKHYLIQDSQDNRNIIICVANIFLNQGFFQVIIMFAYT